MRILIAEDDDALAKFIRQGMEGEHFTVDVFNDGEQALSADLVITGLGDREHRLRRKMAPEIQIENDQGELISPGTVYLAPAGLHMRVDPRLPDSRSAAIRLDKDPAGALHIPSVDVMMTSVAQVFRNRVSGVIMTGMGSDGSAGMSAISRQGGLTIGQDEASCAVYGMPRVCAQLGVLAHCRHCRIFPFKSLMPLDGADAHRATVT